MSPRRLLIAPALVALALAGCGPQGPSLSGSLSQFFPLTFTSHEVINADGAFQITYFNQTATEIDVVAQVTIDTSGFNVTSGKSFNLAGEYAPGHPRTVVTHVSGNSAPANLPPVATGVLTIDSGGPAGKSTSGSFNLSFGNGGDFGSGSDLSGTFDTMALASAPQ